MTTYYDHRSIQITSESIRVRQQVYPLAEISQVWQQRAGRSWSILAGRGVLIAAILGPLAAAGAGLVVAARLDAPADVVIPVVVASLLVGFAAGPFADLLLGLLDRSYLRGARRLELWARWRGRPVRLLQSQDALRFGQIYRALGRAIEHRSSTAAE